MKSSYSRRHKRDLKDKIIKEDLKGFGGYLRQPRFSFYSDSCRKTQSNLEELPEHREIPGEYLEENPELFEIAFSYSPILNKRESDDIGVLTSIIDMDHEQAIYENEEGFKEFL